MKTRSLLADDVDGMRVVAFDLEYRIRSHTPLPLFSVGRHRIVITTNIEGCHWSVLGRLSLGEAK
jgi:hypothetical protein